MQEDIAKATEQKTAASRSAASGWNRYGAFVGLDVHKDTIAVAVALAGHAEAVYRGEIAHEPRKIQKWLARLNAEFEGLLLFCYEAGPCGYGLYRQLIAAGHECQVVAPSLIPKKAGERVKKDLSSAIIADPGYSALTDSFRYAFPIVGSMQSTTGTTAMFVLLPASARARCIASHL